MREKEMWVREGARRGEARAGGGREAGKGEEREGQREERKLGQKTPPESTLKKNSSHHYKSNIKYNIKVTFYTEIIHMAHFISYGAFVLW